MIALEAGDAAAAGRAIERALRWAEADWLATAAALPAGDAGAVRDLPDEPDDDG